jgi:phytoene dehydrogenase-like protein
MMCRRPQDGPIVVVGAGIGGLLAAAGLCRADCRQVRRGVVVLERLPFPGGRFSSVNRDGYQLSTGAVHTLPFGSQGPMARLLRELAPSCPIRDATPSFHAEGRRVSWHKPLDVLKLLTLPERAQFVVLAYRMGWSKGMRDEPFGRWVRRQTASPRIYRLLERAIHFGLSAGPDDVPCCEIQRLFLNWYRRRNSGVVVGGCGRVVAALVEGIERGGGTVRTRTEVTRILVQEGAVYGVRARGVGDGQEYVVHTDAVISDAGPKATVALLDGGVPEEVAQRVSGLREARGLKFHLASDEPLLPDAGVMFCLDTQRVAGVVQPSHADPDLAPPDKHLLLSHQVMQTDDFARERALGLADLRYLFGDRFEVLSVTAYRGRWPVNRAVQGHDVIRLPVRGLHVVGDGCKAPGYLMVEGVARQVERVLGELAAPGACRISGA